MNLGARDSKLLDFYCNNFTNKYKKLYLKGR